MSYVKFNPSKEDGKLIQAIVARALPVAKDAGRNDITDDPLSFEMDLIATHCNGCPLRLADLLQADGFNFAHDVFGIVRHIDRHTGQLDGRFLPRFAQPKEV